jgi:glutamyl-tRNA synthetase
MTVRVRIAPSPTGDPHVGTAYVALFNRVWARKHGGSFILRIEDTDQFRSTPESEAAILQSLHWLGLDWDEGPDIGGDYGPYRQSERTAIYREHADTLIASNAAYRCFCTRERLDSVRKAQMAAKESTRYDGHCKTLGDAEVQAALDAGTPHVVRLAFPKTGTTVVVDGLRGEIEFENHQIDDQVLLKSDGFPTYHLANVVDDHLMKITDVIRAEEWISSTPKHLRLYEAFGWDPPKFWHLPLLRNADKSKISKRKNPVSLEYYERIGILPEALRNFLGLLGWSMPDQSEQFSFDEMVAEFGFDRLGLAGPVFDLKKLEWLNGQYIRELSPEALVERIQATYLTTERLLEIIPLVRERIERLDAFVPMTSFLTGGGLDYPWENLVPKKKFDGTPKDIAKALRKTAEALDNVRSWTAENIEAAVRAQVEELGWKAGHLFTPIRVAVSGRMAAPPLFDTMVAVGSAICRARIRGAAQLLKEAGHG